MEKVMKMIFRVIALAAALTTGGTAAAAAQPAAALMVPGHRLAGRTVGAGAGSVGWSAGVPGGRLLWAARHPIGQPSAMTVSPDGSKVFVTGMTGNGYGTVAYDAASGAVLWQAVSAGGGVAVSVSPDGSTAFVTGGTTVAYNATTGAMLWEQRFPGSGGSQVAVSPDGALVFATGYRFGQATTVAYRAAGGATVWTRHYPASGFPSALVVSPDGSTVFVADQANSGTEYLTVAYEAATGDRLWARHYHGPLQDNISSAAALTPDGSKILVTGLSNGGSAYDDATVTYNAATGATMWVRVTAAAAVLPSLAVSRDGAKVFVAGGGTTAAGHFSAKTIAYTTATGARLWRRIQGNPAGDSVAKSIAVSPDGSKVFVAGWDPVGYLTIAYSAATGARRWLRSYPNGLGFQVAADPDGSRVFVTGQGTPPGSNSVWATVAYSP